MVDKGDVIHVPKFNNNILIYGQVNKPSSVPYVSGKSAKEYVADAGGFNKLSDTNNVIIIIPNGDIARDTRGLFMLSSKEYNNIYPGSLVYVPNEIIYKDSRLEFFGTIAPIFSSLALSIASLNSLE